MRSISLNILLVDDDEDDYILIRELLSDIPGKQIKICWAAGYNESLEKAGNEKFDAILLDYDLGAQDGLQWIHEAHAIEVTAPIIMVTGRGSYEKDVEAMQAGASDYISKSEMTGFLLERAIRYALERKQTEQKLERRVQERTAKLQNLTEELSTSLEEMKVLEEELREQNLALEEVRTEEDKERIYYQELIQNAPIAFLLTDPFGNIRYANQQAEVLLSLSLKGLTGKPVTAFIARNDLTVFRQRLASLSNNGNIDRFTARVMPREKKEVVETAFFLGLVEGNLKSPKMIQIYLYAMDKSTPGDRPSPD